MKLWIYLFGFISPKDFTESIKRKTPKENMKLTFIALFVAATVNGQDYFEAVDKRGGDARFATGVMGAGFNRISKKA